MQIVSYLLQYYLNAVIILSLAVYVLILYNDTEKLSKNSMVYISEIVTYSQFSVLISIFFMIRIFMASAYVQSHVIAKWIVCAVLVGFTFLFILSFRTMWSNRDKNSKFLRILIIASAVILVLFMFEHDYIVHIYNLLIVAYSAICIMFCLRLRRRKIVKGSYGVYILYVTSFGLFALRFLMGEELIPLIVSLDSGLAVFSLLGLFLTFTHYAHIQREEHIDSLKEKNEMIKKIYYYDEIVKCNNFRAFEDEILDIQLKEHVVAMNIKNFAQYNNLMGYAQGDELLRAVVTKIRELLPMSYRIYRLYADRFLIWCKEEDLSNISKYIYLIHRSLDEEYTVGYKVESYFGITKYNKKVEDRAMLSSTFVKELEIASTLADEKRVILHEISEEDMIFYEKKINLQNNIYRAISKNEFIVYYQPQIEQKTKQILSLEALVRWQHDGEIISPGFFIDYAEDHGFILDITKQVVELVFIDITNNPFMKDLVVSINISPVHLLEEEFYRFFKEMLQIYNLDPKRVVLELTENVLINDMSQVVEGIQRIKDLGVQFSLDDFGTGYSSLHRFMSLNFDEIKFDKSFIDDIKEKEDIADFLKLVNFFKASDMRIVVEGIETKEQVDLLEAVDIDLYQGYYFHRPKPIEVLQELCQ